MPGWQRNGTGLRMIAIVIAFAALTAVLGASGCSSKTPEELKQELEALKKKEKPKPPFDRLRVFTEPNEQYPPAIVKTEAEEKEARKEREEAGGEEEEASRADPFNNRLVKPGHWTGVLLRGKTNHFDFSGDLNSTAVDVRQTPIPLEHSAFQLFTSRPAALPKGQPKILETMFFAPRSASPRATTWISNRLRNRQSGTEEYQELEVLQHMPNYQYHFLVLSRDANRYRYLKILDSVRPPVESFVSSDDVRYYYRVLIPKANEPLALSTQPLCWTSLAYVIWDDVLPAALSAPQQQAMLDWLHWGGGLIISGPQTLDTLRGSFLDPYLPATAEAQVQLGAQSLAPLDEHWTIPETRSNLTGTSKRAVRLSDQVNPWSGVKLAKHADAEFMPNTGELVVERRVGRGRVVATAFRLSERELVNWRSFDGFFSACLLHRPSRKFDVDRQEFDFQPQGDEPARDRFDPEIMTGVRYFTRDMEDPETVAARNQWRKDRQDELTTPAAQAAAALNPFENVPQVDTTKSLSGPGGWNDFSFVSTAARKALREAAGISIPKREFVLWMIGAYLIVIVPVNWLVFRALGRVEWAWVAVPVVAVAWGVAVIWLAQLNIGFARAETEIAVLEGQSGYARAHLTRYTAVYSSLSTSYNLHLEDPSAVAAPLALEAAPLSGQSLAGVTLQNRGETELDGLIVRSNSTGMIHSEQMFDLGGALDWKPTTSMSGVLENNSRLKYSGVVIVTRPAGGEAGLQMAWLGDVPPAAKADARFEAYDKEKLARLREQAAITAAAPPDYTLNLRDLVELSQDPQALAPGDVRLVGWRDEGLPGVRVVPAASQARKATLVVCNLRYSEPPWPKRDVNLRAEARDVLE